MSAPDYRDVMGRFRTLSLFYETNKTSETPVFTLKPRDTNGYTSLKRLYLEIADPTEYEFAMTTLGSWEHWQRLSECDWFSPYVTAWRDELEVKIKAEAVRDMRKAAASGNKDAAKWLAEKGWDKRGAGRPSKEEKKRALTLATRASEELMDDLERIGIES